MLGELRNGCYFDFLNLTGLVRLVILLGTADFRSCVTLLVGLGDDGIIAVVDFAVIRR